jgi:hypothetical protein
MKHYNIFNNFVLTFENFNLSLGVYVLEFQLCLTHSFEGKFDENIFSSHLQLQIQ